MRLTAVCLIALLLSMAAAQADISPWMSYQGVLRDASGSTVPDGSYSIEFAIFNAEVSGANLWTETQSVTTSGGVFDVYLGSVVPLDALAWDVPYWLGMRIEGEPWLVPRTPLTTVPYAAHAGYADTVLEGDQDWTIEGDDVYHETGYVGIGLATGAGRPLDVLAGSTGAARFRNNGQGFNFAVHARNEYGTAGAFFGGTGSDSYPSPHAALYAYGQADHRGLHVVSDDRYAVFAYSSSNQALHASTGGTVCAQFDGGKVIVNDQIQVQQFYMPPGTGGYVLTSDAWGVGTWQPPAAVPDADWTVTASNMYSAVTGRVGVGANAPTAKLHVYTGANEQGLRVYHDIGSSGQTASIERGQIPSAGNDILQLKAPAGSGSAFQFLECEQGSTVTFAVNGDGSVTSQGGGSFSSDYLDDYAPALEGVFTGSGDADVVGVYGEGFPSPGFGIGGQFVGGRRGVSATVMPQGTGERYALYGTAIGGPGYTYGVVGIAASDGGGTGVYGAGDGLGYGGYFIGDTHVSGTLTASTKAFKIDHPLDPENRYLMHSSVESDEMVNIYNGNAVLDGGGEAWVELPDWFEVLNQDFRYQLTPIGAPGPNLYIAREIEGGRFLIAGGEPDTKVSWQVTGVRHDPVALANPMPVEVDKPAGEIGKYVNPEVYGKPASLGVSYVEPVEFRRKNVPRTARTYYGGD